MKNFTKALFTKHKIVSFVTRFNLTNDTVILIAFWKSSTDALLTLKAKIWIKIVTMNRIE